MEILSLEKELSTNPYPGRGVLLGRSEDGERAVIAYFIMGRSENSRNRIFSLTDDGLAENFTHLRPDLKKRT